MSKAANMKVLEELHAAVAKVLKDALSEAEEASPQMLAQAIKFLKDNGVEPAKDIDNSALDELARKVRSYGAGEGDPTDLVN